MTLPNWLDEDKLDVATQALYGMLLADDDLSKFFIGRDVQQLQVKQCVFLRCLLSGVTADVDLRRAHAPLLRQGLNHQHFDQLLIYLEMSLAEARFSPTERKDILQKVETLRRAVLGETHTHFDIREKSMFSRISTMLYAVVCYAIGMAVLAFTAGWLGGFLVPVQIDAANGAFSWWGLGINLGLVVMFAVQHSVMARPGFKAVWTRIVPPPAERATYILASSVAMFVMMWFWQPLGVDIWRLEGTAAVMMYSVYALGWFVLVTSTFFLNHFDLFGLRQAWLNLRGQPYTHIPFKTPGYYAVVRHPIYVGWLLLIWATPAMTVSHLVFALATTAYILAAIPFEERDLDEVLPEYAQYRASTPALVPGAKGRSAPAAVKQT